MYDARKDDFSNTTSPQSAIFIRNALLPFSYRDRHLKWL